MNKAFKFRIYPNESQKTLIHMTLGHNRFLWNKMLEDKQKYFELTKNILHPTPAQYKDAYPFLKEVDSLSLANTQLNQKKLLNNSSIINKTFQSFILRNKTMVIQPIV